MSEGTNPHQRKDFLDIRKHPENGSTPPSAHNVMEELKKKGIEINTGDSIGTTVVDGEITKYWYKPKDGEWVEV